MITSALDISLISFSSTNSQRTLLKYLSKNGFNRIKSINSTAWLSEKQPAIHGLLLLQIEQLYKWRKLIIDTLKNTSKFSNNLITLVILNSPDISANEQLLNHCDEFISWPCNESELAIRINKLSPLCINHVNEQQLIEKFLPLNLIGQSDIFLNLLKKTIKIAACDAPVLIEGDTGTGKELIAHALHYLSKRCNSGFIPINCGSLSDQLFDNELYGHTKGAFTDAKSNYKGLIYAAEGGTLFLDEIEALSPKAQVSLLRFLQDYHYRPLGSTHFQKANIRIVIASNQSLKELVRQGAFREDLYYRLNIMLLKIPRLEERGNDIELLINHFIKQYKEQYQQSNKEIHPAMLTWMKKYHWPGNIRELENMLHRAFLLSDGNLIFDPALNDIFDADVPTFKSSSTCNLTFKDAKEQAIKEFEINFLTHLMNENSGNISLAAKKSGKERSALGKLLKKYKLK